MEIHGNPGYIYIDDPFHDSGRFKTQKTEIVIKRELPGSFYAA